MSTHDKEEPHDRATDIPRRQRRQLCQTTDHLRVPWHGVRISGHARKLAHEAHDVRGAAVVGVDADRDDLAPAQEADDEVAEFVCCHHKQLAGSIALDQSQCEDPRRTELSKLPQREVSSL